MAGDSDWEEYEEDEEEEEDLYKVPRDVVSSSGELET